MEVHFILIQQVGSPKKFKLGNDEHILIGRAKTRCQLVLDDELASSLHCKIFIKKNKIYAQDLDSKNGLFLNQVKILHQQIYLHDKLGIASSELSINPKHMDNESILACQHDNSEGRQLGEITITLDPDAQQARRFVENRVDTKTSRISLSRKRKKPKGEATLFQKIFVPIKYLFAIVSDLIVSFGVYLALLEGIILLDPDLEKIREVTSFAYFFSHEDIIFYSGICAFIALFIFRFNRSRKSGSLGERLFGVNQ